MNDQTSAPRDIIIDNSVADTFEALTTESDSAFKGMTRKDLFVLAAAIGFDQGLQQKIESRHALANLSSLSDDQRWVLKAIAIKKSNHIDILDNKREIYKIAGEFATGGVAYLDDLRTSPENMWSHLSTDIIRLSQDIFDDDL
ncbi:hypothetical protein [Haloprofundus salinisoli]|uniref:hypothetical protein n=1 Tax=Haloprofundus salinisoli TaxID=2876193 RepID=UPI001CCF7248|nr:hypothetical protein [Haloprofundus salinisoli]